MIRLNWLTRGIPCFHSRLVKGRDEGDGEGGWKGSGSQGEGQGVMTSISYLSLMCVERGGGEEVRVGAGREGK